MGGWTFVVSVRGRGRGEGEHITPQPHPHVEPPSPRTPTARRASLEFDLWLPRAKQEAAARLRGGSAGSTALFSRITQSGPVENGTTACKAAACYRGRPGMTSCGRTSGAVPPVRQTKARTARVGAGERSPLIPTQIDFYRASGAPKGDKHQRRAGGGNVGCERQLADSCRYRPGIAPPVSTCPQEKVIPGALPDVQATFGRPKMRLTGRDTCCLA